METVRFNSRILHPEVQSINRQSIQESLQKGARATLPFYNKYEYTALIGIRSQQLAEGAKPLVSLDGMNTSSSTFVEQLAKKEIHEKKLPFIIHRRFADGNSEFWSATELSTIW